MRPRTFVKQGKGVNRWRAAAEKPEQPKREKDEGWLACLGKTALDQAGLAAALADYRIRNDYGGFIHKYKPKYAAIRDREVIIHGICRGLRLSADRGPGSVRIATSISLGDLRPAVNVDGMSIGPALQPVRLVSGTRNDRPVAAGIWVPPGDCRSRAPAFKRLHLSRVCAPPVFLIHGCADPVADQTADGGTCETRRDALAGPASELRSNQTTGHCADKRARVLLGA